MEGGGSKFGEKRSDKKNVLSDNFREKSFKENLFLFRIVKHLQREKCESPNLKNLIAERSEPEIFFRPK
jgi:hypothetical protein